MARNWFRNTKWNDNVARHFYDKLQRARDKHQPLRIQATLLAQKRPAVALELLEQYFELPENFDRAQAYVDQAEALMTLKRFDEALESYERALECETAIPNITTQACLEFPLLIGWKGYTKKYNRALEVLDDYQDKPIFPREHFYWHAARALILGDRGDLRAAMDQAQLALDWAAREYSGFWKHPKLGLVGGQDRKLIRKLKQYTK
jgi:tetratricopeptide (TPR) repeat protein